MTWRKDLAQETSHDIPMIDPSQISMLHGEIQGIYRDPQ